MALNIKKFATDTSRATSGVKMPLGEGAFLLVARWGNPTHKAALERLRAPHKDKLELGVTLTEEEAEDIMARGMAEGVLVGWGGLTGLGTDETAEEPYTVELAEALLRDKEMEEIRTRVFNFSTNSANYRKAALQATEKN